MSVSAHPSCVQDPAWCSVLLTKTKAQKAKQQEEADTSHLTLESSVAQMIWWNQLPTAKQRRLMDR